MPRIDFSLAILPEAKHEAERAAGRARIRACRDRAIAAGVTVAGLRLHSDDKAQQRLQAAAFAALRDPALRLSWKTMGGSFVTLDAERLLAAVDAVRAHVQACYDREAELLAALEAGDAPDCDAGWPGDS